MEITHAHVSSYVFATRMAKELKRNKMAKANDKRLMLSLMIRKFFLMILLTEVSFKAGNNAQREKKKRLSNGIIINMQRRQGA